MAKVKKENMPRLQQHYYDKVVELLKTKFGYKNIMEIPKITKISVNMGIGEAANDNKIIANAVDDLAKISGQKPVVTVAKKSEATFKIRKGMGIGCKVTLRKTRMYEFLDRLVNIAMPRIRDFRGLSVKSFDGNGNFSMGLKEQIVFPEINYDKIDKIRGMDITIATTAKTNEEALALLEAFNMPFRKKPQNA